MNISYGKVVDEIFKILVGLGFKVQLYTADGEGPSSDAYAAKYIYTKPDGLMFEMPDESSDKKEIVISKPDGMDIKVFENIYHRVRNVAKIYGIETTVRSFSKTITPKDFAFKPAAKQEDEAEQVTESFKFSHLKNYFKK